MAAGKRDTQLERLENLMLRVIWFLKPIKKFPTAMPLLSGLTFLMAIIGLFTSLGVTVTPEINMVGKKVEVISVWQVMLTSQRRKTVILHFMGCGRHIS